LFVAQAYYRKLTALEALGRKENALALCKDYIQLFPEVRHLLCLPSKHCVQSADFRSMQTQLQAAVQKTNEKKAASTSSASRSASAARSASSERESEAEDEDDDEEEEPDFGPARPRRRGSDDEDERTQFAALLPC
jgi:hypothetical protein